MLSWVPVPNVCQYPMFVARTILHIMILVGVELISSSILTLTSDWHKDKFCYYYYQKAPIPQRQDDGIIGTLTKDFQVRIGYLQYSFTSH